MSYVCDGYKSQWQEHSARDFHLSFFFFPGKLFLQHAGEPFLERKLQGVHLSLLSQPHHFYFYIIKIFNVFAGQ